MCYIVSNNSYKLEFLRCNEYTAEYAERYQSALQYVNKINELKEKKRGNKEIKFAKGEKYRCISDLEKIIGDKLGSICIDCGLHSYLELTTQNGYEKSNDHGISMRRWATLLAIYGEDPLQCDHWFSSNHRDGEGLLLHIMTAMNYLNDLEVFIHQGWEVSKLQENSNFFIESTTANGRADRISRNTPTAVRFTHISFIITRYLIKDSGYFNDLVNGIGEEKIDDAILDLFNRGRKNIYFYTQEDSAWPILDRLACSFDEINEKHRRIVDLKTFLKHDDVYFNLAKKQFLKKNDDVIVVTDPHEFIYGIYKSVLDSVRTPKGKEGEPFEKVVQWAAGALYKCEVLPGVNYISGNSLSNLELDLVAKNDNVLILGESKYKGRYYDPDAGVTHVENDIIGEGEKQINKRRNSFLNNGTIKTAEGVRITFTEMGVNHVIPIIIHNQEYILPDYRDSEIQSDDYGVHSFSIEGFMIAVFTCINIDNFLTYLQFRREYIKVHREKFFNTKIFDELDICTSFVNGGDGGTYDLNGKYRLVACEVYAGNDVYSIGRWGEFLDEMYHWEEFPEISSRYRDALISSVEEDINNVVRALEIGIIKDETIISNYESKIYNYYKSEEKRKSMCADSVKELAKSYISFEI